MSKQWSGARRAAGKKTNSSRQCSVSREKRRAWKRLSCRRDNSGKLLRVSKVAGTICRPCSPRLDSARAHLDTKMQRSCTSSSARVLRVSPARSRKTRLDSTRQWGPRTHLVDSKFCSPPNICFRFRCRKECKAKRNGYGRQMRSPSFSPRYKGTLLYSESVLNEKHFTSPKCSGLVFSAPCIFDKAHIQSHESQTSIRGTASPGMPMAAFAQLPAALHECTSRAARPYTGARCVLEWETSIKSLKSHGQQFSHLACK